MPTINDFLMSKVNESHRVYNLRRRQLRKAEKELADVLNTDLPTQSMYLASGDTLHLNFSVKDDETGRELAAMLMDTIGIAHAEKRNIIDGAYTIIIRHNGLRLDVDVDTRPCKKFLVTEQRTIEVCGELDTSRYLSAVPLEAD